jgi:hypothetical protein
MRLPQVLFLCLFQIACISAKEVVLPNKCVLSLNHDRKVIIKCGDDLLIAPNVQGIVLDGDFVYGWRDDRVEGLKYFILNTLNKEIRVFLTLEAINDFLAFYDLPELSMSNEKTYWDLVRVQTEFKRE